MRIQGYASRNSVRPGDAIDFMVSVTGGGEYEAALVRLRSPELGPGAGLPGFREEELPPADAGELSADSESKFSTDEQPLRPGSCALLLPDGVLAGLDALTLSVRIQPTRLCGHDQVIVSNLADGSGLELRIPSGDDRLLLSLHRDGTEVARVQDRSPVVLGKWHSVVVLIDLQHGRVGLAVRGIGTSLDRRAATHVDAAVGEASSIGGGALILAARGVGSDDHGPVHVNHFNGRMERPCMWAGALPEPLVAAGAPAAGERLPDAGVPVIGDWTFELELSSSRAIDAGPSRYDGALINMPARAVRSSGWTGDVLDWRHTPTEYAAIHFHDDDVAEAGWHPRHRWVVPRDLPSGCYALRLRSDGDEWHIPFFVRPPLGTTTADIVFLIPTATYAAYANMHLRVTERVNELMHGRVTVLDRTDLLLIEMPGLGKSTYDTHTDGSAVIYSSLRRPVTNFRPKGRIYKFCQDLLIVDWLERAGLAFDVMTDEDLHREGAGSLDGYRVVLTSSHPEYYSTRMLDVLHAFVDTGGRLVYLGGNGFYWNSELHPDIEGVVEVRRAGHTLFGSSSAERHFSFSGRAAGLWSDLDRDARQLCGVGFTTQGFDRCTYYRRTPASRDPRAAFIFEGIDDELIGDFGLLQGGAAGYEIDVFDVKRGSPRHGLVVASSERHSNVYSIRARTVSDAVADPRPDAPDPLRADMVFFETLGGGAVFSVGSIAWSGSLCHNGFDNNVARVTENVLRRFSDPTPFTMPGT